MTDVITLTFTGTSYTPYINYSTNTGLTGTNLVIDWGDGSTQSISSGRYFPSHTYSEQGTYTITITGTTITSIGDYCFYYWNGLTSLTIPNSITSIGKYSLGMCNSLTRISFKSSTPPTTNEKGFGVLPTSCIIYVPKGSLSAYTSATNFPSNNTYIEYTGMPSINNKTVFSLTINNKEVQSIVRVSDNLILYSKPILTSSTIYKRDHTQ